MRNYSDVRMQEMIQECVHLVTAIQNREHEEAKGRAEELRAKALSLGINSPFLLWALAVATDCLGDVSVAFDYILQASNMDPFEQNIQKSFEIISERLRKLLTDDELEPGNPKAASRKIWGRVVNGAVNGILPESAS